MILALLVAMGALVVSLTITVLALFNQIKTRTDLTKLARENLELRRSLRQRAELAHDVAHELKNPITAILCSAEALELLIGPSLDPSNAKCLRYIREYSDHILRLVGNFLDISLGEAGFLRSQSEPIDLVDTSRSVMGLLNANAQKKQVEFSIVHDAPKIYGKVDPKHIKQVLFNLVHNAIKFTPERGKVTISVVNDTANHEIVVSVADTGPGMPGHLVDSLFDPYARSILDRHKVDGRGAGLGLALCKRLIGLSNGTIDVWSEPDKGSTFVVRLPSCEVKQTSEEVAESTQEQPLRGQAFLLVDPDAGAREAVASLLSALGGVVDQVGKATEALEAIGQRPYTAIMIDESIDDLNSAELAEILRNDTMQSKARVLCATGSSTLSNTDDNGQRYLQKPLTRKELLERLGQ